MHCPNIQEEPVISTLETNEQIMQCLCLVRPRAATCITLCQSLFHPVCGLQMLEAVPRYPVTAPVTEGDGRRLVKSPRSNSAHTCVAGMTHNDVCLDLWGVRTTV